MTLLNIKDLAFYGAVGDGTTDDTTALQNALDAGGALYINSGTYKITAPIIQRTVLTVIGNGSSSWIKGTFAGAQTGAWKVDLTSGGARENGSLQGFKVSSNTGPGMLVDLTSGAANYINKWGFEYLQIRNDSGTGYAFTLTNPTNTDGFFCSGFYKCFFQGGARMNRLGDSVKFDDCTFTAQGDGLNIDFVAGANKAVIIDNNFTSTGRAISLGANSLNTRIQGNNIEHVSGSVDYKILVDGATGTKIIDNSISNFATITGALVGINASTRTLLDENTLVGAGTGIYNTASCVKTRFGQRNENTCTIPITDQSTTSITESGGSGGGSPPAPGDVAITYLGNALTTTGASSYTFSAQPFGTADATRQIYVEVYTNTGTATLPSSCTIGGVTATKIIEKACSVGNFLVMTGYVASVPTGTSGSIIVNYPTATVACGIAIYDVVNAQITITGYSSNTITSNAMSVATSIAAGGGFIGAAQCQIPTGTVLCTWTNATEDLDRTTTATNNGYSTSSKTSSTAITPTITATFPSGAANGCMIGASFIKI